WNGLSGPGPACRDRWPRGSVGREIVMACPARVRGGPRTTKGPMPVTPRVAADEARDILPASPPQERIRNFCVIAHIDHGKSTLAARMLQLTGVLDERAMRAQ